MTAEEEAAFDAHGSGPMHDELRARFDDQLRGRPHLTPEAAFAAAWKSIRPAERAAIRDEESGAFAARQAEEAEGKMTASIGEGRISTKLNLAPVGPEAVFDLDRGRIGANSIRLIHSV